MGGLLGEEGDRQPGVWELDEGNGFGHAGWVRRVGFGHGPGRRRTGAAVPGPWVARSAVVESLRLGTLGTGGAEVVSVRGKPSGGRKLALIGSGGLGFAVIVVFTDDRLLEFSESLAEGPPGTG